MKNFMVLITILLGLSVISQPLMAKPGKGHFKKMMKKLELTAEQKEKMKVLRKNNPDMKAKRAEMREVRKKFKEALSSDASKGELTKLHNELQSKKTEIAKIRFEKMLSIREILTPEQRKIFQEMRQKRGKKKHRGKWKNR
jgi:Spy/CpxP family protein refolding chaperone